VRNFFILFSAFTTSRTLTYYTQRKRETRERERRRKEVIAEKEEEYLAALLFRARDFLIESERIPRRFRREEQKSLAQ
jgi:hypothetical protein